MSDDEDQMSRGVKISLIGNSGVGKTLLFIDIHIQNLMKIQFQHKELIILQK